LIAKKKQLRGEKLFWRGQTPPPPSFLFPLPPNDFTTLLSAYRKSQIFPRLKLPSVQDGEQFAGQLIKCCSLISRLASHMLHLRDSFAADTVGDGTEHPPHYERNHPSNELTARAIER
jgi:hypothetical protein